jgi:subtilisin
MALETAIEREYTPFAYQKPQALFASFGGVSMAMSLTSSLQELRAVSSSFGVPADSPQAEETGRYIITFRPETTTEAMKSLSETAGLRVANANDYSDAAVSFDALGGADALVLPAVGVAIVAADPSQVERLGVESTADSAILAIEPERFVYAITSPALSIQEDDDSHGETGLGLSAAAANYLRGYRDALDHLTQSLLGKGGGTPELMNLQPAAFVETMFTWGLQATRVNISPRSGKGVRVGVLDTGVDLNHPDFAQRPKVGTSFVPNQTVQDGHGHGTHCIGTACGPKAPPVNPRYGIAYEALIYAGKVLSNEGSGTDGWILAGINWAITNKCAVISMSLGRGANPGDPFPVAYETAARAGLARGCLIVAAAGNESNRNGGIIKPVGHPASCPSIMAVGAVDSNFRIGNFSNRSINANGGNVDIVGPGVAIRSTWPMPQRYNTISGTSMATPHVAGIAALYAQSSSSLRGTALWNKLTQTARNLSTIPAVDDGAGLVQA